MIYPIVSTISILHWFLCISLNRDRLLTCWVIHFHDVNWILSDQVQFIVMWIWQLLANVNWSHIVLKISDSCFLIERRKKFSLPNGTHRVESTTNQSKFPFSQRWIISSGRHEMACTLSFSVSVTIWLDCSKVTIGILEWLSMINTRFHTIEWPSKILNFN